MKKFYFFALTFAFAIGANAQSLITKPSDRYKLNAQEVLSQRSHHGIMSRAQSFYMDHSVGNYDDGFYVWQFNSLYTNVDSSLNFAGLSLSKIAGFTDPADPSGSIVDSSYFGFMSSYPMDIGIIVDSIFAQITHENNSQSYDRFTFQVVELNAQGAPAGSNGVPTNVLWEVVDSTNVSLSSGGQWLGQGAAVVLAYATDNGLTKAGAGSKLGLIYKYEDPTKQDTSSILAGYMKDPANPNNALKSTLRTSYMRYPPMIPNVTLNSNVGYGSPVGSQGWFEAQNWGFWANVSVGTDIAGYQENPANGFRVIEAYPNPTNNVTNVSYRLGVTSDVSLVVTDIVGKVVYTDVQAQQTAGKHTISLNTENLNDGVYIYTFTANNASVSKKFVVKH
ncbi:MAG: T9SS type A sorting domain-containing protein [Bacteroidia bacterium]|nr:T9SS type A sorting domain-containing protein [Bacteroidia bacterium]MCZ2249345.1 T9SS type A sorting domain-containing protein [Bacteroidia bacterium]